MDGVVKLPGKGQPPFGRTPPPGAAVEAHTSGSAIMQNTAMTRARDAIARGMPGALTPRANGPHRARGARPPAPAGDAARDAWIQANAGARAQSDFWIRLLVVRCAGRPEL